MTHATTFWNTLAAKGEAPALWDEDSKSGLTYSALHARVARAAEQLRSPARSLVLLFANSDIGGVVCYVAAPGARHAAFLSPTGVQHPGAATLVEAYRPHSRKSSQKRLLRSWAPHQPC